MYYAKLDLTHIPPTRSARDSLERQTLERLLEVLPPHQNEIVRADLTSTDLQNRGGIVGFPDNPEAARLLGIIYSVWKADRNDQYLGMQQELATVGL